MPLNEGTRPSNAGWMAKVTVTPTGDGTYVPPEGEHGEHPFESLEVAWYDNGRIKLTLREGAPAVLRQVYLAGKRDVIIEVAPREEDE
jgi:hypothetical protein